MIVRKKEAVNKMRQTKLLRILQILSKYVEKDSDELSCDGYSIRMSPAHKDISEGDRNKLEELGVVWSPDYKCWQVFF